MLIKEGDARSQSIDLRLAAVLSFVAGALNVAGFKLAGVFSANMTGNITAMAENLAYGAIGVGVLLGLLVLCFITGAFLVGLSVEAARTRHIRSIYAWLVLAEGIVLIFIGLANPTKVLALDGMQLIFVLSFVLGVQNATTTRISKARVRTTHVSGMATDIGLAFAAVLLGKKDGSGQMRQLQLHTSSIIAFLIGGVVGATVLAHFGTLVFAFCGVILLAISGLALMRKSTD